MGRIALIVIVVIVLVAAAGVGGYSLGNQAGFQRANQIRQQFFAGRGGNGGAGGAGGAGGGGFAGGFGRSIPATVKSVNGDVVVVTVGQRDVNIQLNNQTQILKSGQGSRSDLVAGARVMITAEGNGGAAGSGGAGATGGAGGTGGTGGGTGSGRSGGTGGGTGGTGGGGFGMGTFNAASIVILPPQ